MIYFYIYQSRVYLFILLMLLFRLYWVYGVLCIHSYFLQLKEIEIKKGSDKWTTLYCQSLVAIRR